MLTVLLASLFINTLPRQLTLPPRPLTVEGIRKWHQQGGLRDWPREWPIERRFDLNRDGKQELFLAVGGFSRGMDYAGFTRIRSGWKLIAEVQLTPPLLDALSTAHNSWHDLITFQRSGRGGYITRVHSWDGTRYVEKSSGEITYRFVYQKPR